MLAIVSSLLLATMLFVLNLPLPVLAASFAVSLPLVFCYFPHGRVSFANLARYYFSESYGSFSFPLAIVSAWFY